MSEDNKKPGQRDISDLKARLGLKKPTATAMPAVTPAQGSPAQPMPNPGSGPAAAAQPAQQRAIPSPFGQPPQAEPAPQPAAPPDPRRDPFAQQQAANLAAFYGINQVIPGDASGVQAEPISKPKMTGRLLTVGGLCLIVFGVGNACGRITNARVEFNRTIDHAQQIRDEIDGLAKQLNSISDVINSSKVPPTQPDFDMVKKLGDLDLKKPDTSKIFHTNYYHLEDIAIDRLMNYYNNTIKLYDAIQKHAKRTDTNKEMIESGAKANANAKSDKNYGVVVANEGGLTLATFAEVGTPVCQQPDKTDCSAAELKGFKYRTDSAQSWGERPVKGKPELIIIPLKKSPLFNMVAAGNPDILELRDYIGRMGEIKGLWAELLAQQKPVLEDLKRAAERPKVFTF